MAGPIPASKTIRCSQRWLNADGRYAQSSFYLQYTGSAPTGADLIVLATGMVGETNSEIMPLMHTTWTSDLGLCVDLTSTTSATGEYSSGTAGALAGARLPASTALVVSSEIAIRYRGGHPRVYLPVGDATKLVADNQWDSTFVTDVTSAWETVVGDTASGAWAGAGTVSQVAASFYDGFTNEVYGSPPKYRRVATPRAAAVLYPVITQLGRAAIGTQRRRLRSG